jgi:aryl-alcohol dehydrogenase-like predicted oxidoreductase
MNLTLWKINLVAIFFAFSAAKAKMEYVQLTDQQGQVRKLSRLIMGTDHLVQPNWVTEGHPESPEAYVFKVLDEAVRLGINVIDTSPIYVGNIENLVGRWLESRKNLIKQNSFYAENDLNPDRQIYIISKGGFPFDLFYSQRLEKGSHSDELKSDLQSIGILQESGSKEEQKLVNAPPGTYASRLYGSESQIRERVSIELGHTLANLGNGLTVYLMHRDDFDSVEFDVIKRNQTQVETIMKALSHPSVKENFPMLGWSNWTTDRVNKSIGLSNSNPELASPQLNSPYFSLFEMSQRSIHARGIQVTHREMMDANFQKGIYLMSYSPLGGFSILDKPEPAWENAKLNAEKKFRERDPYWQNVYHAIFTPENEVRYYRALKWIKKYNQIHNANFTLDQLFNAYALAHVRTNFLTVGPITIEQVRRTVDSLVLSKQLGKDVLEELYTVENRDFSKHLRPSFSRSCLAFYN